MFRIFSTKPDFSNLKRVKTQPAQEDRSKGILPYGTNNNFPLRLALLVQNSPTATSCIATLADFIAGGSFADASLKNKIVNNQGMRFIELHRYVSYSYAMFEGFALNVKYNLNGQITELYPVAFETCRLTPPDSNGNISFIKVNANYGSTIYRRQDDEEYPVFNPKAAVGQMKKMGKNFKGQILFYGTVGPLSPFYPAPSYYSAEHWMAIDEAIGGFHEHNVNNGFWQTVMIKMFGDQNKPSTHPDDMTWDATNNMYVPNPKITQGMRFEQEMQKFQGWNKAGNIMVQWATLAEQFPEISAFPFQDNSNLFKALQDITTEQIARATRVPAVLANIQSGQSLGGDGNQVRVSVKLMQTRALSAQDAIGAAYMSLLPNMTQPVNSIDFVPYNPFPEESKVDPYVWGALTIDEKRDWIKKNTEFPINGIAKEIISDGKVTQIAKATAPPMAAINSFSNVMWDTYPQEAVDACLKARNFYDSMNPVCGTKFGWQMNQDLIDKKPVTFKQVKRIHRFLNGKQEQASNPWNGNCDALLFHAWGGKPMMGWCAEKIKEMA